MQPPEHQQKKVYGPSTDEDEELVEECYDQLKDLMKLLKVTTS